MSALQQVQTDFQDYVLGAGEGQGAIVGQVQAQGGLAPQARLAIYHRAYRSRLREALCEAYERTWTYAGDDLFGSLADDYVANYPSRYCNLRWYGDRFARHCLRALPDFPFLAELAEFEWTLGLAFDAPDAPALDAGYLQTLAPQAWDQQAFHLHPSVRLLTTGWNTVALWQALHDAQTPPLAEALEADVHWLVWRTAGQPHFRSLDAFEMDMLRRVGDGARFAQVCEAAAAQDADPTSRMAGLLAGWLAQGLLTARAHPRGLPV